MIRSVLKPLALAIIAAGALAAAPAQAALRPGAQAPDFTARAADGAEVKLSELKGKTVVLEWANYECPFVKMHYSSGNIPGLQEKYTGKDVVWLTVMSSAPGKQGHFNAEGLLAKGKEMKNHASHVLMDGDGAIGRAYEAKTTPHLFVIDAKGVVQYNGAVDSVPSSDAASLAKAQPWAAQAIDAVLAGKTPNHPANAPYGCGVKYDDVKGYDKK